MFALQSIMKSYEMCLKYLHSIVGIGVNEYFIIDTTFTYLSCVRRKSYYGWIQIFVNRWVLT